MAQGLPEIASDEKRNAHFFKGVDEWERILWIGARVGPKYRDLKRERLWKLLKWISALPNDFEQQDFFGSQGRRGLGDKFPNGGAPAQSECQQRNC
jgi:hypothetical protein